MRANASARVLALLTLAACTIQLPQRDEASDAAPGTAPILHFGTEGVYALGVDSTTVLFSIKVTWP